MKTKLVSYFYPSSPCADYFGMPKGGYCVGIRETQKCSTLDLAAFETEAEAYGYAEEMHLKWDFYDLRITRNRLAKNSKRIRD